MTVCIAALCENGTIFGVTDRMLTAGDVEFEPVGFGSGPTGPYHTGSKMTFLTNSIVAMTAGDAALQAELIQDVFLAIGVCLDGLKATDKMRWIGVKEVAQMYRDSFMKAKRERAAYRVLSPLGLDINSFMAKQGEMNGDFVSRITEELLNFKMPSVGAIFAGVDETGSHIYAVDSDMDSLDCHDSIGFAAIGSGGWHAQTQFMLAGHDRKSATMPETLFLAYLAKKRSEVAPGVGKDTDMFIAGPLPGSAATVSSQVVERLEDIYKRHIQSEVQAFENSKKDTVQYVDEITESTHKNRSEQTATAIEDQSASPDGSGV